MASQRIQHVAVLTDGKSVFFKLLTTGHAAFCLTTFLRTQLQRRNHHVGLDVEQRHFRRAQATGQPFAKMAPTAARLGTVGGRQSQGATQWI